MEVTNMALYRDKQGNKLYPVCSWERNQHKLYNALDRAHNHLSDTLESGSVKDIDRAEDEIERIEQALCAFERFVFDGIVYAKWEDACLIKDYVAAYDARP
jgi:hypothetical protein